MGIDEGRQRTDLTVESFTLRVNDDLSLHNMYHFGLDVSFELWRYKKSLDHCEPDSEAYCELYSVKVLDRAYLSDDKGFMLSINPMANMLDIITEAQYDKICTYLLEGVTKGVKL
jgi:hypothetical protein